MKSLLSEITDWSLFSRDLVSRSNRICIIFSYVHLLVASAARLLFGMQQHAHVCCCMK